MQNYTYSNNITTHSDIINVSKLIDQYYNLYPDLSNKMHNVIFGTSGHRGSSCKYNFNEAHVLAISQAIVQVRAKQGITGPCYLGKDTRTLSEPAFISVLEVLTANFIDVIIQENHGYTPTPVISHAIVRYNKHHRYNQPQADGITITASHNPPEDGGIKYHSIYGGSAPWYITEKIEYNANKILLHGLKEVNRITLNQAWKSGYIHTQNFLTNYIKNLSSIINMSIIKSSGLKLGVHPLSGSSIDYWRNIAQYYQLDLELVHEKIDKTFNVFNLSPYNCIRLDCSFELLMIETLSAFRKKFDLFFVNDSDCDRHGIITSLGPLKFDNYIAVAIHYLLHNRPLWTKNMLSIGTTNVSSTITNQIARKFDITLLEVPVGFKWFSQKLFDSNLGFASEESAGASFLDFTGNPWSTDKDGLIMCLLAAEITAIYGEHIQKYYEKLIKDFNRYSYNQKQFSINYLQKSIISNTLFHQINIQELTGDPIIKILNIAPSNINMSMNGIKIITQNGWAACRLSGTELMYKIYCESFIDDIHRKNIEKEIMDVIFKIINKL